MRRAASRISDAMPRTEQPAAAQREDRSERRSAYRERDLIQRLDCYCGFRQRPGNRRVDAVIRQPVGDGVLAFGLLDRSRHAWRSCLEARDAQRVDGNELRICEVRGAERTRRLLGIVQTVFEQRCAPFDCGGRVVELVRQSGRQFAE